MVYLALLRGVNVGGKNLIRMDALKSAFEGLGFTDVKTYIQSGNVIFSSAEKDKSAIAKKIREEIRETFGADTDILVFTGKQIRTVVAEAPPDYGTDEAWKYDVLFFADTCNPEDVILDFPVREGVDRIHLGRQVIYAARLKSLASRSHISRIIGMPFYRSLSIRNWNTTRKLNELLGN
ncbi:DUF1697 domain-containing protein [Breznakiella homolactica]|uniref:DUF1697 domain-containing protein n=1 Tax=Breznakiella homolactica TaxID=2798577 RepID=A0A7T8B8P0_9SPIR|nr:DUF1697 domain-containing protein [Breznakiella homolactica]QQO08809.1 DUF1697 domain-containing protein [Breznakiella homolactica]